MGPRVISGFLGVNRGWLRRGFQGDLWGRMAIRPHVPWEPARRGAAAAASSSGLIFLGAVFAVNCLDCLSFKQWSSAAFSAG